VAQASSRIRQVRQMQATFGIGLAVTVETEEGLVEASAALPIRLLRTNAQIASRDERLQSACRARAPRSCASQASSNPATSSCDTAQTLVGRARPGRERPIEEPDNAPLEEPRRLVEVAAPPKKSIITVSRFCWPMPGIASSLSEQIVGERGKAA
jgi:hypothetical protein